MRTSLNPDMDAAGGDLSAAAVKAADLAIENWLTGVRNVLRFTERLPMLWILVQVEDDLPAPNGTADVPEHGRRSHRHLLLRRLVQLYIDSHLERRLKRLGKILTVECLSVGQDEHAARLRNLMASIDGLRSRGVPARVRAWLLKYITPFVLFVVGPVAILDGFDMEDLRRAVTLIVLLLSLALYVLLFRLITVQFGFVPKRALWSGGTTVEGFDAKGKELMRHWKGFPTDDLYRREAEMFAALRSSAKPERPIDISVGSDIATMIAIAGLLAGLFAWLWFDGPSPWLVVGAAVVVSWSIVWVKEMLAHRRLRAARLTSQRVPSQSAG